MFRMGWPPFGKPATAGADLEAPLIDLGAVIDRAIPTRRTDAHRGTFILTDAESRSTDPIPYDDPAGDWPMRHAAAFSFPTWRTRIRRNAGDREPQAHSYSAKRCECGGTLDLVQHHFRLCRACGAEYPESRV